MFLFQMFEGIYAPPLYKDIYAFYDGAQNDVFQDATVGGALQTVTNHVAQSLTPHGLVASSSAVQATTSQPADVPVTTPASQAEAPSTPSPSPSPSPSPVDNKTSSAPAPEATTPATKAAASQTTKKWYVVDSSHLRDLV